MTHADTEILCLRMASEELPEGFFELRATNPADLGDQAIDLDGAEAVIVRLFGGRRSWEGFDRLMASCVEGDVPLLCFGGEAVPDAELMALSTVPGGVVTQAFAYLVQGGAANVAQMLRFVADTVLRTGFGFEPPAEIPAVGVFGEPRLLEGRPTVGVVFYRAHLVAGNTTFVTDLCRAIEARGANALAVACYSLRDAGSEQSEVARILQEHRVSAIITTVLAAGSFSAGDEVAAGLAAEGWGEQALGSLGVPILHAIASSSPSSEWESSPNGLGPLDVAWGMALPELDGRIIGVPFSWKEVVDDGEEIGAPVTAYRTLADRTERIAGLGVRLASLRAVPRAARRIALVLSAYPTKRSRLGNAVGLDTPASLILLLKRLAESGYRVDRIPASGDELMAELADGLAYDRESLTVGEAEMGIGTLSTRDYTEWFSNLAPKTQAEMRQHWGPPPGSVHLDGAGESFVFSGLDLGGVLVAIQPPRGFGEHPVAIYHSPVLPPTHHYLAFYRFLDDVFGADAVVHVGKHGTLEWLPGKGAGLSAQCYPDLALGDVPLVYPFVVNDPGEGAQAKRRAHAVVVDHLVPPLTRADSYDEIARLEVLLDEYARVASLDPAKLPAIRSQVWQLLVDAEIHRDLGIDPVLDEAAESHFDELVLEVDGYLCELKDAQIKGGLHVLGQPPVGEAMVDFVLALTRLPQGKVPSLRGAVASAEFPQVRLDRPIRTDLDAIEGRCRRIVEDLAANDWQVTSSQSVSFDVESVSRWICDWLVPALCQTTGEIDAILSGLDGCHIPPGPSGAPSRGMAHVLPTGRNFYSLDPKAVPSRLSMDVGERLADSLVERHLKEEGSYPRQVAIVVWGTSAMRTGGDDIAEVFALLGVRPVWAEESGRVERLEVVPIHLLGRPRVDVTVRISGLFRDAFPHVVALIDEAVTLVKAQDHESVADNPLLEDENADPRVYGPAPGSYGSGILPLIESRNWRSDDDLAEVYLAWSGWSYSRGAMGMPAGQALARRLAKTEIAVKNQDNREHDIFDSDDYLQDHGGMIAAIRSLRGTAPKALFGDSSDPSRARVRSLSEEAARVVRSRVLNPKWIGAMQAHGYKGAFEMAATVDYLFGYDATAKVVEDWMYERVTSAYVGDPAVRKFFEQSNPWALRSIAERLLEANERGMWEASAGALETLRNAVLEAEGWEEDR
jgi:cobaltochelatase CobN